MKRRTRELQAERITTQFVSIVNDCYTAGKGLIMIKGLDDFPVAAKDRDRVWRRASTLVTSPSNVREASVEPEQREPTGESSLPMHSGPVALYSGLVYACKHQVV
jgi:hypothetical protein